MNLVRYIKVRVFPPSGLPRTYYLHAKPRHYLSEKDIEKTLHDIAEVIERESPLDEYELKELAGNQFNFIWVDRRKKHRLANPTEVQQGANVGLESPLQPRVSMAGMRPDGQTESGSILQQQLPDEGLS